MGTPWGYNIVDFHWGFITEFQWFDWKPLPGSCLEPESALIGSFWASSRKRFNFYVFLKKSFFGFWNKFPIGTDRFCFLWNQKTYNLLDFFKFSCFLRKCVVLKICCFLQKSPNLKSSKILFAQHITGSVFYHFRSLFDTSQIELYPQNEQILKHIFLVVFRTKQWLFAEKYVNVKLGDQRTFKTKNY